MNSQTIKKFYHLVYTDELKDIQYVGWNDMNRIVNHEVLLILEQIEDAKLSELGEVIEKLKEEYK